MTAAAESPPRPPKWRRAPTDRNRIQRAAATAAAAWPDVAEPPGPDRSQQAAAAARTAPDSPTQTVTADGVDDSGRRATTGERAAGHQSRARRQRPAARRGARRAGAQTCVAPPWRADSGRSRGTGRCGRARRHGFPRDERGRRFCTRARSHGTPGPARAQPRPSHGRGDDTGRAEPQLRPGRAERPVRLRHRVGAKAITVLNTATDKVSRTIKIPQGPPQFVSFSPDSRTAYVSVYNTNGSGNPHRVHRHRHRPGDGHRAGEQPHAGSLDRSARTAGTSTCRTTTHDDDRRHDGMSGPGQDVIDVINTATKKLIDTITVPPNPHWVVFGKDGLLYVTDHMSAKVTVVNADTNKVVKSIPGGRDPARHIHLARRQPPGGHELRRQRGLRRQHRDRQGSRDDPGRPGTAGHRVLARRALHLHRRTTRTTRSR